MRILINLIKSILSLTPDSFQEAIRSIYFRRQIKQGRFITDEPEFGRLDEMVKPGDWVIDIGANIGHYTIRLSELVGPQGRVFAFEPVPITFAHLTRNTGYCRHRNVTLINAAVSEKSGMLGMSIPILDTGLKNYYMASISDNPAEADVHIATFSIDALALQHPVTLIKIDAEGHEPVIFRGIMQLINRDRPTLIVESVTDEIREKLNALGYAESRDGSSPNVVFSAR